MFVCRTIVYIGVLGSAYCLIGCDTTSTTGGADSLGESPSATKEFFSAPIDELGAAQAVTVEADSVTMMPTTVELPNDLWENEPEEAAFVLDASAITVTMTGESSKRAQLTAKGTEKHATMSIHIAPPDHEACGSESVVGPFNMTIVDGVVTLTNESQPLDAAARSAVGNGRFGICAETWADFDGVISIEKAAFEFGTMPDNEERVEVCHVPPGDPGNVHTITIAASAVPAHLAHGDYLGECEAPDDDDADDDSSDVDEDNDGDSDSDDGSGDQDDGQAADIDNDGIDDAADLCPNTPEGETADEAGCSCSQRDVDSDGVNDCDDACPNSEPGTTVTDMGCAEDKPGDECYVEYDYTVIGNDGHSLYLDGEYIDGAGFGQNLDGTLRLSCGEHSLDVVLYNSVAGGAILFGSKIDGVWTVASEHPQITLRAEDGTPDAWSVYRKLGCEYHSPYDFVPEIDSFETTFWMTVPERGAGLWNTNDATKDHWIIWDDYASTVVFPQSFWVSRTTLIVSGNEDTSKDDDADGVHNGIDACPDTAIDATVDETGCSCEQQGDCDSDGDGVFDHSDDCPDTAPGDGVDEFGCEITAADTDGDGIADDADACPDTVPDATVDDFGCSCTQLMNCDSDSDGVFDQSDDCPNTTEGDEVSNNGCTVIVLKADAGPDVPATEGDIINVVGQGLVLSGDYLEEDLVFVWEQVDGTPLTYVASSPLVEVNTSGATTDVSFRLTVSTEDGDFSDSDTFVIAVAPAAEDTDEWSVYGLLNVGSYDPFTFVPTFDNMGEAIFQEDIPDANITSWTINWSDTDFRWIIWDDHAIWMKPNSFWVCRTILNVSDTYEFDYRLIGNDGHSIYLNGVYITGGGFGNTRLGTLTLSPGDNVIEVLLYNGPSGGAILFQPDIDGSWGMLADLEGVRMRAYEP